MRRRPSGKFARRAFHAFTILIVPLSFGCWEQIDDGKWFPQMKRQITVQAFEEVIFNGQQQGFTPPEGTVPTTWGKIPDLSVLTAVEQDALQNPTPKSFASLERGKELFDQFCVTCHGSEGHGDGPLAGPPFGTRGPMGMVLPIAGPSSMSKLFSDGHIYATISLGRGRMPSYKRIRPMERWDLINYIRDLNGQ